MTDSPTSNRFARLPNTETSVIAQVIQALDGLEDILSLSPTPAGVDAYISQLTLASVKTLDYQLDELISMLAAARELASVTRRRLPAFRD